MKKPIVVIMLATLAVAGASMVAAFTVLGDSTASAAVKSGECVTVANHSESRADVTGTSCQDGKATFKVGKVLADASANCPEAEDDYTAIVPNSGVATLCLLPNFVEGACYKSDDNYENWTQSTCEGEGTVKITKVISGSNDVSGCPDSEGMGYPEPPVTYCVADAQL